MNLSTALRKQPLPSNPFKLYSVLKGLNQDELAKIEKITLYDDPNTTAGWDWLSKFTQIPVEHIEIDRVTDRKSLVDVRMTASVVTDFYRDGITSFIIVFSLCTNTRSAERRSNPPSHSTAYIIVPLTISALLPPRT